VSLSQQQTLAAKARRHEDDTIELLDREKLSFVTNPSRHHFEAGATRFDTSQSCHTSPSGLTQSLRCQTLTVA
jgi:hypothetical protein